MRICFSLLIFLMSLSAQAEIIEQRTVLIHDTPVQVQVSRTSTSSPVYQISVLVDGIRVIYLEEIRPFELNLRREQIDTLLRSTEPLSLIEGEYFAS
jgi:hypothetical protein